VCAGPTACNAGLCERVNVCTLFSKEGKWTVFPSQKKRLYAERLRQLERLGLSSPCEFDPKKSAPSNVTIEQLGSDLDSPVVDLRDGRTLYVVWVSVVAERPGVCLYDYRFEPPWPDRNFETLPSFTESCVGQAYVLPNKLEYTRQDILNFRIGKTGWRLPYTRVEGVLCAVSATPIPDEFKHGASIPVGLKFFGRSGQQLAAVSLVQSADRFREPAVNRPTAKPPAAMDEADPGVAVRPRRSNLYGPQSGGNVLPAADQPPEKGSLPDARVHEGSSRTPRQCRDP
jgi:hypothetical protein